MTIFSDKLYYWIIRKNRRREGRVTKTALTQIPFLLRVFLAVYFFSATDSHLLSNSLSIRLLPWLLNRILHPSIHDPNYKVECICFKTNVPCLFLSLCSEYTLQYKRDMCHLCPGSTCLLPWISFDSTVILFLSTHMILRRQESNQNVIKRLHQSVKETVKQQEEDSRDVHLSFFFTHSFVSHRMTPSHLLETKWGVK